MYVTGVVLTVTGVLTLLFTVGIEIYFRRNGRLCHRTRQLPKQKEYQDVQLSDRDLHINNLILMRLPSRPCTLKSEDIIMLTKLILTMKEMLESTSRWRDVRIQTFMKNFILLRLVTEGHISILPSLVEISVYTTS
ncbi:uncharacterized protein LOC117340960 isoform X2 [Pecten maximus]|uniref:uncharacterized protein LOC117340960 isoform X2 n=1 Tax=Pecten maximus TaxID=6579 RepID=UPI0014583E4F|nr:uncharacterized protein LOC117340960 isoform X2 [Pecten maximus]